MSSTCEQLRVALDEMVGAEEALQPESRTFSVKRLKELRNLIKMAEREERDTISLVWHIEDVKSDEVRRDLTNAQAREVLAEAKHNHDANYGIGWDTLKIIADDMFPRKKR